MNSLAFSTTLCVSCSILMVLHLDYYISITFELSSSLHGIPIAMDEHKLSNTVLNLQIVRLSNTFQYIVLLVPIGYWSFVVA